MYDIPMHTAETTIFEQLYVNHQPNSITENDGLPFLKELIRVSINLQLPSVAVLRCIRIQMY